MRAAALGMLAVGCVPALESPTRGLDTGSGGEDCAWEAPENTWERSEPPCLTGEGFSKGEVVPDMRLMDQHGDTVSLWQFYGSLVVLDFSTMWCAPCAELAEGIDETWEKYGDEGFMYLSIISQDVISEVPDLDDLNKWADDHSITAPVLADDQGYTDEVIPPGGAFPLVMLLDRDMTVLVEQVTPVEDAAVQAAVEAAL